MLHAFGYLLCFKLCQRNWPGPNSHAYFLWCGTFLLELNRTKSEIYHDINTCITVLVHISLTRKCFVNFNWKSTGQVNIISCSYPILNIMMHAWFSLYRVALAMAHWPVIVVTMEGDISWIHSMHCRFCVGIFLF